jgi:nucleotide-binding universal stress UspA family protein
MAIPNYGEISTLAREMRKSQLEEAGAKLAQRGISVDTGVLETELEAGLLELIAREKFDLLVLFPTPNQLDITRSLLRSCRCPVWVARAGKARRRARVLAAVGTDSLDERRDVLNTQILQSARLFASALGGPLEVLHVWNAFAEGILLRSPFAGHKAGSALAYLESTRAEHQRHVASLLKQSGIELPERSVHFVKGEVCEAISNFCSSHDIDLLVIGSVARAGVSAILHANTAECVLDNISCSMLVVKPAVATEVVEKAS